ncbi:MAG: hypothetical protein H6707_03790 [Deltaproteobacteria bacterium]|nr:hypothetical protein [Deltaproteobacteria bacterium]
MSLRYLLLLVCCCLVSVSSPALLLAAPAKPPLPDQAALTTVAANARDDLRDCFEYLKKAHSYTDGSSVWNIDMLDKAADALQKTRKKDPAADLTGIERFVTDLRAYLQGQGALAKRGEADRRTFRREMARLPTAFQMTNVDWVPSKDAATVQRRLDQALAEPKRWRALADKLSAPQFAPFRNEHDEAFAGYLAVVKTALSELPATLDKVEKTRQKSESLHYAFLLATQVEAWWSVAAKLIGTLPVVKAHGRARRALANVGSLETAMRRGRANQDRAKSKVLLPRRRFRDPAFERQVKAVFARGFRRRQQLITVVPMERGWTPIRRRGRLVARARLAIVAAKDLKTGECFRHHYTVWQDYNGRRYVNAHSGQEVRPVAGATTLPMLCRNAH